MARLGREDWERAALDAIAVSGLAAVAVEPLARTLGVTKGSFYAHFANRDELIDAALARWEAAHGAEGIAPIAGPGAAAERLRQLLAVAVEFSQSGTPSPHVALMSETRDERVREMLQRVTASRLAFITAAFRELGLTPARARHRARLLYSSYLGLLQMARESPDDRLDRRRLHAYVAEVAALLIDERG